MSQPYRQCSLSVLDTLDDPHMTFDAQGRCHYYHAYKRAEARDVKTGSEGETLLQNLAERIRADGRGKPYDCIMGLSGGVDSSYVAWQAHRLGLRPLAVHLDNGWNSELSVQNIEQIVTRLNMDLYTHVLDWNAFRDLQRAYLKASVIDIEVITDHAIFALLYRIAGKKGIKHILSGTNVVTEFVLPPHWIFNKGDHVNIQAIHKAYGTQPLVNYPFMDLRVKKWLQLVKQIRSHSILNWVPYHKAEVKQIIQQELGWRDYGGKHFESIFTRFYQGYILPTKFGVDKRKAHLSNLIFAGQLTKQAALKELESPPLSPRMVEEDRTFVIKKLGFSPEEFTQIMQTPPRPHSDFAMEQGIFTQYPALKPLRGLVNLAKKWVAPQA
ncbi:ExsB family protein [Magnetococcus marinus MC-1]|uniref:ExsB family protein n=1 Tax=Magnetococcus marinus (strain ATCC BAA-1437 / JCM 17883 / MC-1) TaxID=156889 RepID=A0LC89_MAGMM|nr:N-acetyl sugar amidotransferase [Magnetococcus marinus]ABK45582.1 ExsB family protein [Magnetococcus marinus MC-1]